MRLLSARGLQSEGWTDGRMNGRTDRRADECDGHLLTSAERADSNAHVVVVRRCPSLF